MPAQITPRLLTLKQAAVYCGVSAGSFRGVCPVSSISLGPDARFERWDVKLLDRWLDRKTGAVAESAGDDLVECYDNGKPARGKRRAGSRG